MYSLLKNFPIGWELEQRKRHALDEEIFLDPIFFIYSAECKSIKHETPLHIAKILTLNDVLVNLSQRH
jgi:hypothetical protein